MFDAVSFNHVLEHILYFKPFLAQTGRILKDDGVVYAGMPNYNSLMQKWLKQNWYGWGMPDHVWHFEPATFKAVMMEGGFEAKGIKQNTMGYSYSKSLRKNTIATVARIADRLGCGDQALGVFKKVIFTQVDWLR
jgi:predicted SAM-dependent methyltransferase